MPDPHSLRRRQRPAAHSLTWAGSVVAAVLIAGTGVAAAGEANKGPKSVFASARAAVARGQVTKSHMLGFSIIKTPFSEAPAEGAVLIGFDLGLGYFLKDLEVIYALRPLYRTASGETYFYDHGLFVDPRRRFARQGGRIDMVLRTVRLKARPGYAVAGITLRTGLFLDGMSLTFMRIRGRTLDPRRSYTSAWVGNRTGGREASLSGAGSLVVGVFGNQDEYRVLALGLIYVNDPAPQAQPPDDPAPAQKPAEPPAALPAPPVAPAPAPPPPAEPKNDPAAQQAAEAEPRPATAVPRAAEQTHWLPFVVFGGVALSVFLVSLVFLSRRKHPADDESEMGSSARNRAAPPASAAVPARPGLDREPRPSTAAEAPLDAVLVIPDLQTGVCAGPPKVQPTLAPPIKLLPAPPLKPVFASPRGRGVGARCSHCSAPIPVEAGLPPWCPRCGADLKTLPRVLQPTSPVQSGAPIRALPGDEGVEMAPIVLKASQPEVSQPVRLQPPFFLGRGNRLYRVYILPQELLFLDAPQTNANQIAVQGAILGGLIGGLIGGMMAAPARKKAEDRRWELDWSDTHVLLRMAATEPNSFRVSVADLRDGRLEVPSFWQSLFSAKCAARLHFRRRERGAITLALPTALDVQTALEQLPDVLGDQLSIHVAWDKRSQRYVPRA